jgi:sterol desaturase/sphingolipid hydroxylase (fatty acid hydroxylase superfamily)
VKLVYALAGAGVSFVFLAITFWPLEKVFAAKRQQLIRPHWWTDLAFFAGQYLLWTTCVFALLHLFREWLGLIMPTGFREAIRAQPWLMQAAETLFLSDLFVYWGHRLQHRYHFLWRFHAVHHSAEHLDWLAAHREHPIDTIYTLTVINLPAFILGFPLDTLAGVLAFRGIWAIFLHSNVRLPLGPIRMLIGSPELHHWHHSRERESGNYANISPLMDVIFGTYNCPDHDPDAFGLGESYPSSYLGQLLHPFRRRRKPAERSRFNSMGRRLADPLDEPLRSRGN